MHNIKYSQPSPPTILLSNYLLQELANINTQNLLSTSNPHYHDSASDKISYPVLVTTPSSCLFTCSLSPTIKEQWLSLHYPSSPTSSRSSSSLQSI